MGYDANDTMAVGQVYPSRIVLGGNPTYAGTYLPTAYTSCGRPVWQCDTLYMAHCGTLWVVSDSPEPFDVWGPCPDPSAALASSLGGPWGLTS